MNISISSAIARVPEPMSVNLTYRNHYETTVVLISSTAIPSPCKAAELDLHGFIVKDLVPLLDRAQCDELLAACVARKLNPA